MTTPYVNPAAPTDPAPLTTVAEGPPKCDDCDAPAVFAYAFPWTGPGSSGVCCAAHAVTKQQIADNTGRSVILSALPPPTNQPLTRDERVRLKAEVYALEEETKDLKQRGLDLYNENTRLTSQLHAATARQNATRHQLEERDAQLSATQEKLEHAQAELGELQDEADRLRTLTRLQPAPPETPARVRGLEGEPAPE